MKKKTKGAASARGEQPPGIGIVAVCVECLFLWAGKKTQNNATR